MTRFVAIVVVESDDPRLDQLLDMNQQRTAEQWQAVLEAVPDNTVRVLAALPEQAAAMMLFAEQAARQQVGLPQVASLSVPFRRH